jgi:hypothetical protein
VSKKSRIIVVVTTLAALSGQGRLAAADGGSPAPTAISHSAGTSSDASESLQEVTVTAQHLKLDWAQRNELVQKAIRFVFGIAPAESYAAFPPGGSRRFAHS